MRKLTFSLFLLVTLFNITAQERYDIKDPGSNFFKQCQECINLMKTKPAEIKFGIQKDESNILYFVVSHKEWFDKMFDKSGDGIAVDIISKERYDCSVEKLNNKSLIKGELQRPVYLREMKKNMISSPEGYIVVSLGRIPQKFIGKDVEFNIAILKDKYLCHYNGFFDLKTYRWDSCWKTNI